MARNIADLTGLQASVLLDPRRGTPGGRASFIQNQQQQNARRRALMEQRGVPLPAVGASRPLTPPTTPAVTNMGSVTPPRNLFTSGLVAPAGTAQIPPRNGTTGGTAPQIINLPTDSPATFSQMLKDIMRNILAGTGNQNLISAGQETAGGLLGLPEELAATPGFAGLNLSQARRLESIKEAGLSSLLSGITGSLEQRQSRIEELGNFAQEVITEQIGAQKEIELEKLKQQQQTTKDLEKRREDAIKSFFDLRESIANEGVPLSAESGQKFLQELQTTDNPEEVLNNYMAAAFNNPSVIAAFKPKKSGRKGGKKSIKPSEVSAPLENADLESFARDLVMGSLDESDLEYELSLLGIEDIDKAIKLIKARAELLESALHKNLPFLF